MSWLQRTVGLYCACSVFLGAAIGYWFGHRGGEQAGLAADVNAREMLVSELDTVTTLNQQQTVSLQTAEASIAALTQNIDAQQRAHESEVRELELYRRIESRGNERGMHVDEVQLVDLGDGPTLRITLLQVGSRNDVQGSVGVAFIGADLPGSVDNRLVLADPESGTGLEFDFQFMTRLSMSLPIELLPLEPLEQPDSWLSGLDLLEIDLIPLDNRIKPKRVTLPADRMIVGPAE